MVSSIQPSDASHNYSNTQSPQERQKYFEIQFETAVLSSFVAITQKNSPLQSQLSKIKNGLDSGEPPEQLATHLNHCIAQINQTLTPEKLPFPPFNFSTEGSQVQTLCNFTLSVQKFLNTAAEKGELPWNEEQKLFSELSSLGNTIGQMTPEQAFDHLNGVIERANRLLPRDYQIPTLPLTQRR